MPEGRFVSRQIAHSEQLAGVSLEADYLFTRAIPHLDREGRMSGNPILVKSTVCPLRPEIDSGSIPDLLRELAGVGLVRWYALDSKQVLEFPTFGVHQKGLRKDREAASRFPPYDSTECTDLLRTNSGPTPDELPHKFKSKSKSKVSTDANASGENADVDISPDETIHQHFGPILKATGFLNDKHDHSMLKAMDKKGKQWQDIEAMIYGLAYGRDTGALETGYGISKDDPLSLRILYAKHKGTGAPITTDAIETWYPAHLRREHQQRKPSQFGIGANLINRAVS